MQGSILKRGDQTYLLRISLGYDETTGKRVTKSKTVHGTRKEAAKRLRDWITSIEGGALASEDKSSLNSLIDEWLNTYKKRDVSESTFINYNDIWRIYIKDAIGSMPINRINQPMLRKLYGDAQDQGVGRSVVRTMRTVIKQALDYAVDERRLSQNPAVNLRTTSNLKADREKKNREPMTREQLEQLFAVADDFYRTFYRLAAFSGARPGECLGLEWKHILFDTDEIYIEQALVEPKNTPPRIGPTKTVQSVRKLKMPPSFMAELREHKALVDKMRLFAGKDWEENNLVFPSRKGKPKMRTTVRAKLKRDIKKAGLPDWICLYTFRHTCATILLESDVNIKVVSERLGHANVKITLEVYFHVMPGLQERAANKLESIFFAPAPETNQIGPD